MASSTIPGGRKEERVRLRDGPSEFQVASLDDRQNVYCGIDYTDRMAIVFALNEALPRLLADCPPDPELRRDYVTYVALSALARLVRTGEARWGSGSLGAAQPPIHPRRGPEGAVVAKHLSRRAREARRPENLLRNSVRGDHVLPQFKDLNFPIEIRNLKAALFERCFSRGVFLQSSRLTAAVAFQLHQLHTVEALPPEEAEHLRSMAANGQAIPVPYLQGPLTGAVVPATLDYYGLGRPARTSRFNGYYLRPWLLQRLNALVEQRGSLQLGWLDWMAGRYRVVGQNA